MSHPSSTQPHPSLAVQKGLIATWSLSPTRHCLDVRPPETYSQAHLIPSTSIPLATLEQRFSQLPPRGDPPTPFLLLAPENAAFNDQPLASLLTSRGWTISAVVEVPPDKEQVDEIWDYASDLGVLGTGSEGTELLFKASPVVSAWIGWIEENMEDNACYKGSVLDIGCGSGRDLGFLVSRGYPWSVTGLDNWSKALNRAAVMVKSINPDRFNGLINAAIDETSGHIIPSSSLDHQDVQNMFDRQFSLVLVIRFFPREMFRYIHTFVENGGYLIFSHFTDPPEGGREYESPPRGKRVRPGEVEGILCQGYGWEIMQGAYSTSEDGRAMWDVVARKA